MVRFPIVLAVVPLLATLACSGCAGRERMADLEAELEAARADQARLVAENRQLSARLAALTGSAGEAGGLAGPARPVETSGLIEPVEPAGTVGNGGSVAPAGPEPVLPALQADGYGSGRSVEPAPPAIPVPTLPEPPAASGQAEAELPAGVGQAAPAAPTPPTSPTSPDPNGDGLRTSAPGASGGPVQPAAPARQRGKPQAAELDEYNRAVKLATEGRTEQARKILASLLAGYPDSPLAPNFHYWTGEALYRDKRYGEAVLAFKEVHQRYPKSLKAPDALLMAGQSYERLGDRDSARLNFQVVTEDFPDTHAAEVARAKLGRPAN
jgi:tol-pal system protein YbgF